MKKKEDLQVEPSQPPARDSHAPRLNIGMLNPEGGSLVRAACLPGKHANVVHHDESLGESNYFTEMCSGSEAGSYSRLMSLEGNKDRRRPAARADAAARTRPWFIESTPPPNRQINILIRNGKQ